MAHELLKTPKPLSATTAEYPVSIENPAGVLDTLITAREEGGSMRIDAAAYRRSAQILLKGRVPLYNASAALFEALKGRG